MKQKNINSNSLHLGSVLRAQCPACQKGKVIQGMFTIQPQCPVCHYNFHPEPGFYLGAIAIGFLLSAMLTVPPLIFLKIIDADLSVLIAFPLIEFLFVTTFLMFYSRILWLHLEYRMTQKLDGNPKKLK